MALETYRQKRNFQSTPEPDGKSAEATGNAFVIQKHDATRLHYDFRLEMDGVLKSWAVTKGPSLLPGEKRLAVHVEDHPLEYGDFEGTIPKGQYGGGTVLLWDQGTWSPIGDPHKGYAKGHLEFELGGQKLAGRWHLVRMHGKPREKRENWLLIKGEDEFARMETDVDILEERPESAKTGRSLEEVAENAAAKRVKARKPRKAATKSRSVPARTEPEVEAEVPDLAGIKGARKAPMPDFIEPMLATLVSSAPRGERWLHEIKFDGYRLLAHVEAGRVKLLTRSGLDWIRKFGKGVVTALQDLPLGSAIMDGELVVETSSGATDFSALQADLSTGRADRFIFYVFDLPYLDGYDLGSLPLIERKRLLEKLIPPGNATVRLSGHIDESGAMVLQHACRLSLEGIVSKLRDAPYRPGRGKSWVKSKCSARQEFVIGGYVPSTVSRKGIGSLALGVYEGGKLQHVGRVGTGFSADVAELLQAKLERLRTDEKPFENALTAEEQRGVRYVRPELVAEVEFRAWTADGHLRHASFRGLREDKMAKEIAREAPKATAKEPQPQRQTVKLTHADRLYWPEEGITKEGLADFYADEWRLMAPYVVGRPLALLRCPNGIEGERFFQKHAWKGLNPNIVTVADPQDPGEEPWVSINDLDGMMGLVQSAALEIHPWGSTIGDWERPDIIILDLDPGEDVPWQSVLDAAQEVRQRLKDAGLSPFVKTSGGKGLHVVAPLRPSAEWPEIKAFTNSLAEAMASDSPDRYVATITKSKRHGKILIDYLRNQRGQTTVAPYSTRARPGAAVSTPITWEELEPGIGPAYFTVANLPARLAAMKSDPWDGFRTAAVPLEAGKKKRKKAD